MNTNIEFLKRVVSHPEFVRGDVETGFIQVFLLNDLHFRKTIQISFQK